MQLSTISLIFISGFAHSLWNLLSKKAKHMEIFFALSRIALSLMFLPYFLYQLAGIQLSSAIFLNIVISGTLSFLIYAFTAKAYKATSLSIAYPIVRSSALFVPLFAYLFLSEKINFIGFIGILITVFGIFLLSKSEARSSDNYYGVWYAISAAIFLALQCVVDKTAVQQLDPTFYFYLYASVCSLYCIAYLSIFAEKHKIAEEIKINSPALLIVAFLNFFSFVVFLYAVRDSNISYAVAVRQVSFVFNGFFSWFFLKEIITGRKILATLILTAGVVVLVLN